MSNYERFVNDYDEAVFEVAFRECAWPIANAIIELVEQASPTIDNWEKLGWDLQTHPGILCQHLEEGFRTSVYQALNGDINYISPEDEDLRDADKHVEIAAVAVRDAIMDERHRKIK